MPLQRRLPKFGFSNPFRKEYTVLNLSLINSLPNDKDITPEQLVELGVIKNADKSSVKILGNGDISKAYTVKAHKFSQSAMDKIKKAGGKVEVLN
jgi:large subunit ribosomal protein L15